MNCKKGEMAFVVKSYCGNEMKVVTCLEFLGEILFESPCRAVRFTAAAWKIEPPLIGMSGRLTAVVADRCLRPIRPGDMEDETPVARELEVSA